MMHPNPRHELVHLSLSRATNTRLHIQENVITTDSTVSEKFIRQERVAQNQAQRITHRFYHNMIEMIILQYDHK